MVKNEVIQRTKDLNTITTTILVIINNRQMPATLPVFLVGKYSLPDLQEMHGSIQPDFEDILHSKDEKQKK